jgi:hypothetical protein
MAIYLQRPHRENVLVLSEQGERSRNTVMGKAPQLLGYNTEMAEIRNGGVCRKLCRCDGSTREAPVDHIVGAEKYKVDPECLRSY